MNPRQRYIGSCINLTHKLTAGIVLSIESIDARHVAGTLEIYGDLVGGSEFTGTISGNLIRFETENPQQGLLIRWEGRCVKNCIRGTYSVYRDGAPRGDFAPASEEGKWTCTAAEDSLPKTLHGNN